MRALIKYQTRIYFCLVFVLDSLMAEEQNTAVVEEAKDDHQEKKDEVEEPPASKVETPVPEVAKLSDRVTRIGGSNGTSAHDS